MRELFSDIQKYGWTRTRAAEVPTPKHRHRRKRKAGATALAWQGGKFYRQGISVIYSEVEYICLVDHYSTAGQFPSALPLLWLAEL